MKRTILILASLSIVISLAIHYTARSSSGTPPNPTLASAAGAAETAGGGVHLNSGMRPGGATRPATPGSREVSNSSPGTPTPGSVEAIAFAAALDTLTSPHATYAEKQAAWKQLQDSGRLADAAVELERRMAVEPKNSLYPAALGQAYLKLCATSTDVRAQAIWAMTADADFETALNLDPSNWEARFTRAVAMSYWPDNLNKGPEVIAQLNLVIQQQEEQPPQPQFAGAYEWLGKQYQKAGQTDAAQQAWQRGAALYPNNPSLQNLLAGAANGPQ